MGSSVEQGLGGPLGDLGAGYSLQVRQRLSLRASGFSLLSLAGVHFDLIP